ncbi:uncharacterized protein LOC129725304 [Wyeomyia smithii]|uniref:uncharacterized protein LOC129725304 n=1 Tax=Wyeomyia smithii TaxID=174621 RepID=UPI00246805C7|nr:uncharacterized protein LOC129725304 [Wyeomyia smithii]
MALTIRLSLRRCHRIWTCNANRLLHDEFTCPEKNEPRQKQSTSHSSEILSSASIANKYQIFRDIDATVILDIEEERQREPPVIVDIGDETAQGKLSGIYSGINLSRGQTGVYDIEDLVTVLRINNATDIFVCSVPKEIKYVDYICVVTGMSFRHMRGIAEFVRKVYKMKRRPEEIIPRIEGANSSDWMALDLGNIVLHIFSEKSRKHFDLESLWALGAEYDGDYNKPEELLVELFERHTEYLDDLKPLKMT